MENTIEQALREQEEYYRKRANEYDQWFLREERYDHGEEKNRCWFHDFKMIQDHLSNLIHPTDTIIDLAAGTGNVTGFLASHSKKVTALDQSAEMLKINQEKNRKFENIEYLVSNAFDFSSKGQTSYDRSKHSSYDHLFTSFWMSHIPRELFPNYLNSLGDYVKEGGKIHILDQLRLASTTAKDQPLPEEGSQIHKRKLNSGSEFKIIKNFYRKEEYQEVLGGRLQFSSWLESSTYFYLVTIIKGNKVE